MSEDKNKLGPLTPLPSVTKLTQPRGAPVTLPAGAVTLGAKMGIHQRVAQAKAAPLQPTNSFAGFANMSKIMIFLDSSGSMEGSSISLLKDAVSKYLEDCGLANQVGVASFPEGVYESPTSNLQLIHQRVHELVAGGGTPLEAALGYVIDNEPLTHGVIISDGCANSPQECVEIAKEYKLKGIKLDTVHIGEDSHGEQLLKDIAEATGGIYVKFTDVTSFAKSFAYLAPKKRSLLTQKGVSIAGLLGAAEVKF